MCMCLCVCTYAVGLYRRILQRLYTDMMKMDISLTALSAVLDWRSYYVAIPAAAGKN